MPARPLDAYASISVASDAVAVTPSDSGSHFYRALYVGGAGNVSLVTAAGNAVTFTALNAGTLLPVATQRINLTSTTASNLVGLL